MKDALKITALSKTYDSQTQALNKVCLNIQSGDFFALLGANGAGKSTLIGILTGTVIKDSGKVVITDHDIDRNFSLAKQCIGIMPQEFNLDGYQTVDTILYNQAGFFGIPAKQAKPRIESLLKQLKLWDKRAEKSQTLSGGMKRRLLLARALVNDPQILIVDEPTAGVDVELRHEIWNLLKQLNQDGKTILLTTHYLEEVEYLCDHMAMIHHGTIIAEGTVAAIMRELDDRIYTVELAAEPTPADLERYRFFNHKKHRVDVTIPSNQHISSWVSTLEKEGIQVLDIRPKMNRVEQFFLQKLSKQAHEQR